MRKTFADISEAYARYDVADVVLIPVPFDLTSTWGKGADKGPAAFLEAARNMELYDIETDSEPFRWGVFLAPEPEGVSTPEKMVDAVRWAATEHLANQKFVTLLGGEHSISIGAIRAFRELFENLTVLQIDAHADLRPEYEGTPFNHACAMAEASTTCNLIQVGIRSMDQSELQYLDRSKTFFAHEMQNDQSWPERAINLLDNPVYITIDLDAFDPAIMPSTGTPEPGGLGWYETLCFLKTVFQQKNVVGFDIVELCPNPANKAPDFLAAKLYYKLLAYRMANMSTQEKDE